MLAHCFCFPTSLSPFPPGDPVALIGRDGAGKTTLLNVVAGRLEPAVGDVVVTNSVGYLSQDSAVADAGMTVSDRNLAARDLGLATSLMGQPVGTLSEWQRRRVELARILFPDMRCCCSTSRPIILMWNRVGGSRAFSRTIVAG